MCYAVINRHQAVFTCICLDSDGKVSLVVLQGDAVSLRVERFQLLDCSVFVAVLVENLGFFFCDCLSGCVMSKMWNAGLH